MLKESVEATRIMHLRNLVYSSTRPSIYNKYAQSRLLTDKLVRDQAIKTTLERSLQRALVNEARVKAKLLKAKINLEEMVKDLKTNSIQAFASSTQPKTNIFSMIKSLTIQKLIADKQGAQAESQRLEDDLKKEYVLLESRVAAAIAQFKSDQDKMHEKTIDNLLSQLQEIRTQGTKNITNYFWSIAFQYGFYNELETKLQFKKWIENTRTGSFTVKLVGTEAKKTDLLASLNNNPLFAISVKAQATLQEVIESPFNPRLKLGALERAIERVADKNVKNSILANLHTYKMLSFLYQGLSYDRGADSEQKRKNISDALDSFMMYFAAKAIPVGIGMEETPPVILFQLSGTYVYVSTILKLLYKEILQARFVAKSGLSKYVASFSPRVSTMSNIYKNHLKDKKWGTRKNFFENYIAIHKYDFTIPKIYITKNRNK